MVSPELYTALQWECAVSEALPRFAARKLHLTTLEPILVLRTTLPKLFDKLVGSPCILISIDKYHLT
jgi:hypothetical protein